MPLCWIFLLKRRRALSKVSFSPTRTSANLGSPPARLTMLPGHVRPGPEAGLGARCDAGWAVRGCLMGLGQRTTRARRAGGVYTSPAGGSTLLELGIVLEARLGPAGRSVMDRFVRDGWHRRSCRWTLPDVDRALDGWRRFGKGHHPAALNLGDCFAYALADRVGGTVLSCWRRLRRHRCRRPSRQQIVGCHAGGGSATNACRIRGPSEGTSRVATLSRHARVP